MSFDESVLYNSDDYVYKNFNDDATSRLDERSPSEKANREHSDKVSTIRMDVSNESDVSLDDSSSVARLDEDLQRLEDSVVVPQQNVRDVRIWLNVRR